MATGDEHVPVGPPSIEQSNVATGSSVLNAMVASGLSVGSGGDATIWSVGDAVSTRHVHPADEVLPAPSVAVTSRLWSPSAREVSRTEDEHVSGWDPSTAHASREPSPAEISKLASASRE